MGVLLAGIDDRDVGGEKEMGGDGAFVVALEGLGVVEADLIGRGARGVAAAGESAGWSRSDRSRSAGAVTLMGSAAYRLVATEVDAMSTAGVSRAPGKRLVGAEKGSDFMMFVSIY
ncbi:MAG TPA: hypothetical protein VM008_19905 [Phycisphaerae bacterium]|nr:hypothetical protein [Phycisphaerae bacterium]